MKKAEHNLTLFNPLPDLDAEIEEWRGNDTEETVLRHAVKISSQVLRENAQAFLDEVSTSLQDLKTSVSGFELDSVEVSAAITVTGKLTLINIGGELSGEGSLKFIFKRK